MRKIDLIEVYAVVACLLFAITISLYHVSFDGYLGLSERTWSVVWAVSENGFALILCHIVSIYLCGVVRKVFRYVLMPYFILKLIYHVSCYSGLYLMSKEAWEELWSYVLVVLIIVCLAYCINLIRKDHVAEEFLGNQDC